MKQQLKIHYDVEADILEIQIGEPTESYFDEISDDLFEGHDEKTNELKGYKVLNFLKRKRVGDVNIPLPTSIGFISHQDNSFQLKN